MQYIYKEWYSSEWCVQLLYITIACTITTDSPIRSTVSAPSTAALVFTVSRPFIQTDYVGNHMHHHHIVTPTHAMLPQMKHVH